MIPHAHVVDFDNHCYVFYFNANNVCFAIYSLNHSESDYLKTARKEAKNFNRRMKNKHKS